MGLIQDLERQIAKLEEFIKSQTAVLRNVSAFRRNLDGFVKQQRERAARTLSASIDQDKLNLAELQIKLFEAQENQVISLEIPEFIQTIEPPQTTTNNNLRNALIIGAALLIL